MSVGLNGSDEDDVHAGEVIIPPTRRVEPLHHELDQSSSFNDSVSIERRLATHVKVVVEFAFIRICVGNRDPRCILCSRHSFPF